MSNQTRPDGRDPTHFCQVLSGGRRGHKFSLRELHYRLQRTTLGIIAGAAADSFCALFQDQTLHWPSISGPPAPDPQPYSFFRRYSNTTCPIRGEITALRKFVAGRMSFKANVRLFPCPFLAVNSPIKRLEWERKTINAISITALQIGVSRRRFLRSGCMDEG